MKLFLAFIDVLDMTDLVRAKAAEDVRDLLRERYRLRRSCVISIYELPAAEGEPGLVKWSDLPWSHGELAHA